MKRAIAWVAALGVLAGAGHARAQADKAAAAIVDKAINAMGGEAALAKVKAVSWKSKGSIRFGDAENPFASVTTVTTQIVQLLTGDQEFDSAKTLAAFALGLALFLITLLLNLIALQIVRRYREQYE